MKHWMEKWFSRKFWMAVAGVATGIALVMGADATQIQTLAGAVTALASAVTYIFVEGKVDQTALKREEEQER